MVGHTSGRNTGPAGHRAKQLETTPPNTLATPRTPLTPTLSHPRTTPQLAFSAKIAPPPKHPPGGSHLRSATGHSWARSRVGPWVENGVFPWVRVGKRSRVGPGVAWVRVRRARDGGEGGEGGWRRVPSRLVASTERRGDEEGAETKSGNRVASRRTVSGQRRPRGKSASRRVGVGVGAETKRRVTPSRRGRARD